MFSRIRSAVCSGIEGKEVFVETDVARGLPGIYIVGLASTMVMESRERIKSAIINSELEYPRTRITINLTPASLRKNGSGLDLPIALGILASSLFIDPAKFNGYGIIGELALDGKVLGISGVLPMLQSMQKAGVRKAVIPYANKREAELAEGISIYPVRSLRECLDLVNGKIMMPPLECRPYIPDEEAPDDNIDFADISGQEMAKRAIVIASTGRHGLLMIGSPGCGKTMLASRIPTIMPLMNREEMTETAVIYSASGKGRTEENVTYIRPFRHPHHTIGRAGLIGGGRYPVPGEISLAHNGVLFLDEICEYSRDNIEALRIPVEEKKITHFRMGESYTFPCNFQLVMASNPCPCGYFGDRQRVCKCTEAQLEQYRKKLSGPMMDRIDMRITMERVTYDELRSSAEGKKNMSSAEMKTLVKRGLDFAMSEGRTGYNATMSEADIDEYCFLGTEESGFMNRAYEALKMSPRSYKKTLKVARTIADIDRSKHIHTEHLAEALSYRISDNVNE